jgi:hypothetical protein
MAEKFRVNDAVVSFGICDALSCPELPDPLLPQAASTSAALAATDASPTFFVTENNENHLVHRPGRIRQVLEQTAGRI